MENKSEALKALNLSGDAGKEEIEKAYQRLVRRYPPEFNPDRFREIDEAYRFLTSFPYQLERLLSPEKTDSPKDPVCFDFSLPSPLGLLPAALSEIRKAFYLAHLWGPTKAPEEEDHPKTASQKGH
ncbi:MAG: DnaJ domain-containing protein [Thermodesulfobacteriota bacterium]